MAFPYVPRSPSEAAWARVESQLNGLLSVCREDFTTHMLSCLRLPGDQAREIVASLHWDAFELSKLPDPFLSLEKKEREGQGTSSMWLGYRGIPPEGKSLEDQVLRYFSPRNSTKVELHPDAYDAANGAVASLCGVAKLDFASTEDAGFAFENWASCGWPDFVSSDVSPIEYLHEAQFLEAAEYPLEVASTSPGVLQTRLQARGLGKMAKPRAVYGVCRRDNIAQKRLYLALIRLQKSLPGFSALNGRRTVDEAVTRMMRVEGGKLISLDYQSFDVSVPPRIIEQVFQIARRWFKAKDHPLIDYCEEVVHRTGILVPHGYFPGEGRTGGLPSGCVLTNWIGSHVNMWVTTYAVTRCGGEILAAEWQGDDGLILTKGIDHHSQIARVLKDELGMVLSTEKTVTSDRHCTFLQNMHCVDYEVDGQFPGVRSLMRVYGRMGSLEYKRRQEKWTPLMDALRNVQQLDDASAHPAFTKACRWTLEHDEDAVVEVVQRITNNDPSVFDAMESVLWKRGYERKLREDLYGSPVVRKLNELILG